MASLQERNGSYRILFCYHGKLHSFTLGKVQPGEAENKARQARPALPEGRRETAVHDDGGDRETDCRRR